VKKNSKNKKVFFICMQDKNTFRFIVLPDVGFKNATIENLVKKISLVSFH